MSEKMRMIQLKSDTRAPCAGRKHRYAGKSYGRVAAPCRSPPPAVSLALPIDATSKREASAIGEEPKPGA
jgi:hypothetical protein